MSVKDKMHTNNHVNNHIVLQMHKSCSNRYYMNRVHSIHIRCTQYINVYNIYIYVRLPPGGGGAPFLSSALGTGGPGFLLLSPSLVAASLSFLSLPPGTGGFTLLPPGGGGPAAIWQKIKQEKKQTKKN